MIGDINKSFHFPKVEEMAHISHGRPVLVLMYCLNQVHIIQCYNMYTYTCNNNIIIDLDLIN